jgi:hypothetical protein
MITDIHNFQKARTSSLIQQNILMSHLKLRMFDEFTNRYAESEYPALKNKV